MKTFTSHWPQGAMLVLPFAVLAHAASLVQLACAGTPVDLAPASMSAVSAETVFRGGTLAELQARSPQLTFDSLTITGKLLLPVGEAALLRVNRLTITSAGGVAYQYSPCTYRPAPDFAVEATGKVVVDGDIKLIGRSGTRTLSSSSCNQPDGQAGGDVRISAAVIAIRGNIQNQGGAGGTSVFDSNSSFGGNGGSGGAIKLKAREINLSGTVIQTHGGPGGSGTSYGTSNHGAAGSPGRIELVASGLFRMKQSAVSADGPVTLNAPRTDIHGPITGSRLNARIGGKADAQPPQVTVLAPLPNSVIQLGKPLDVRIRATDFGTGVKELRIDGLGHSQIHSAADMANGILAFRIPKVLVPASFRVTARDNQGNARSVTVPGIQVAGNVTIQAGETVVLSEDLILGPEVALTVAGKLVIKHGRNHRITAGSLYVATTGVITDEDVGPEDVHVKGPSLEILLWGAARIDGLIDLSGNTGWDYYTEDGGNLRIQAAGIVVNGTLRTDGAHSQEAGSGASGGMIALISSLRLEIAGTLRSRGAYGNDYYGGDGGDVALSYVTTIDLRGYTVDLEAGSGWHGSGTGGIVITTQVLQLPGISVEYPVKTKLQDGYSTVPFGMATIGTAVARNFTIRNVGIATLANLSVTINGFHANDFIIQQPPNTNLPPGGSTTVKVIFKPRAAGTRNAALHIYSNDSKRNPFDIKLRGSGTTAGGTTGAMAASIATTVHLADELRELRTELSCEAQPDGTKHLTLSVAFPPVGFTDIHVIEVSPDLVNWFSGDRHTTVLRNDDMMLKVRDNTPIMPLEKRYIRVRPRW